MSDTLTFHDKLKDKIDNFVHLVYDSSRRFPKEELYGVTSQLRRAALSVALNYIEGYARRRKLVNLNFLEIAYGSLKETQYLLSFCLKENYLEKNFYDSLSLTADEIGAMIWKTLEKLEQK